MGHDIKSLLASVRAKHDLKNADIARHLNVGQSTISGWEYEGKNAANKHMRKLAELLKSDSLEPTGFVRKKDSKEIMQNMVEFIKRRHLTKQTLAKALKIEHEEISYWLSGEKKIPTKHARDLKTLISAHPSLPIDEHTLEFMQIVNALESMNSDYKMYLLDLMPSLIRSVTGQAPRTK